MPASATAMLIAHAGNLANGWVHHEATCVRVCAHACVYMRCLFVCVCQLVCGRVCSCVFLFLFFLPFSLLAFYRDCFFSTILQYWHILLCNFYTLSYALYISILYSYVLHSFDRLLYVLCAPVIVYVLCAPVIVYVLCAPVIV
jgi:hypothetical protein